MTNPDHDPTKSAEIALDAYEQRAIGLQTITYRGSPMLAGMLIRSLLADLAAYAEHAGIDLDVNTLREVARYQQRPSSARTYPINAEVQVRTDVTGTGPVTAMRGKRGYVSAIRPVGSSSVECTVRFPGVPAGEFLLAPSDLFPAQPRFPHITTQAGIVTGAAEAEKALVAVGARVLHAQRTGKEISPDDALGQQQLAEALAAWTGTSPRRVLFGLAREIAQAAFATGSTSDHAAQVAAKDFPPTPNIDAPQPERRTNSPGQRNSPRATHRP
ncbi:hypothetical protein [Actinomadura hibisca]|uniref:hypothetical protein n=1 Tax=Actinomadura hibisca TaxID=68565 RepID=UPI00082F0F96|nr:hypothetical protein [Actinomadura hibisca]